MSDIDPQSTVGKEVYSSDGANVGHVSDLVEQDGKPTFLNVKENGLFGIGAENFLVPLNAITGVEGDQVTVNRSREDLVGIPAHDGHEPHSPSYFQSLFTWWGSSNDH
jgi:sporulation protein YlmC with PRC-barrel domain